MIIKYNEMSGRLKSKRLRTPSADKDVEQRELS